MKTVLVITTRYKKSHKNLCVYIRASDRSSKIKQEETIKKKKKQMELMVQAAPEEHLNRGGFEGESRRAIFFSQLAIGRSEKKKQEETVATRRNGHSDRATPVRARADRLTGSRVTLFPASGCASPCAFVFVLPSSYDHAQPQDTLPPPSRHDGWFRRSARKARCGAAVHRAVIAREIRVGQGFLLEDRRTFLRKKRRNLSNCKLCRK